MGSPTTNDEHKTGAPADVPAAPSQTFRLLGHRLQPPLPTSPRAGSVLSPGGPALLSGVAALGPQCTQAPRGETAAAPLGLLCCPPLSGLSTGVGSAREQSPRPVVHTLPRQTGVSGDLKSSTTLANLLSSPLT